MLASSSISSQTIAPSSPCTSFSMPGVIAKAAGHQPCSAYGDSSWTATSLNFMQEPSHLTTTTSTRSSTLSCTSLALSDRGIFMALRHLREPVRPTPSCFGRRRSVTLSRAFACLRRRFWVIPNTAGVGRHPRPSLSTTFSAAQIDQYGAIGRL